jgi:hypothetical protein
MKGACSEAYVQCAVTTVQITSQTCKNLNLNLAYVQCAVTKVQITSHQTRKKASLGALYSQFRHPHTKTYEHLRWDEGSKHKPLNAAYEGAQETHSDGYGWARSCHTVGALQHGFWLVHEARTCRTCGMGRAHSHVMVTVRQTQVCVAHTGTCLRVYMHAFVLT